MIFAWKTFAILHSYPLFQRGYPWEFASPDHLRHTNRRGLSPTTTVAKLRFLKAGIPGIDESWSSTDPIIPKRKTTWPPTWPSLVSVNAAYEALSTADRQAFADNFFWPDCPRDAFFFHNAMRVECFGAGSITTTPPTASIMLPLLSVNSWAGTFDTNGNVEADIELHAGEDRSGVHYGDALFLCSSKGGLRFMANPDDPGIPSGRPHYQWPYQPDFHAVLPAGSQPQTIHFSGLSFYFPHYQPYFTMQVHTFLDDGRHDVSQLFNMVPKPA